MQADHRKPEPAAEFYYFTGSRSGSGIMATNDTSNSSGQFAPELVEILKRLGAHRRAVYEQTYGNAPRTREQSDAYWYHPLVRACHWLEQRLGINRHELEQAAFRLTTPLGLKGMNPFPNPDETEGDPGMPDWLWMTGKFRELDLDGTTDRDSTTTRLWRQLSEQYPTILEEAGITVASRPSAKPPMSIGADEAEAVARRLDREDVTFCYGVAKDIAARIQKESGKSCSATLVKGLPFWNEAMERTGRGRKRRGPKGQGRKRGTVARPVNFSNELDAVTAEEQKHGVLEDLAEAEEMANVERERRMQNQAIDLVNRSRLTPEEKRQTITKLEAGEMTPQLAAQMVSICQQDSTRNRKKSHSHD